MSKLEVTHRLACDVLVAGGGPSGVPAAIAAARRGAKVVLVHGRPVLGGNASSEIRMHICGADCHGGRGSALETELRETGIIEELRLDLSVANPQRSASMLDLVWYDKVVSEKNITLLLNTWVDGVEMDEGRIAKVFARRPDSEDRFEIEATYCIDATGDGRLGAEAGAPFLSGREAAEEYGEPNAGRSRDSHRLGNSLLFTSREHAAPMPFSPPDWAEKFDTKALAKRLRDGDTWEYGYWWIETGGTLDTIHDNERIRADLTKKVLGVWDHVKNSGRFPESERWALDWVGQVTGKRESRRFIGRHVLTENDLRKSTHFDDVVAYGGWPLDVHPPEGLDAKDVDPCHQPYTDHVYEIPLRSLQSKTIPNLLFAGRNISATHLAFSSTRVMATCAVMGEAAGVWAALAKASGLSPEQAVANGDLVRKTQQSLIEEDCWLPGVARERSPMPSGTTVRASSEKAGAEASHVLDGERRSAHGPRGAHPSVARPGLHRWMSTPEDRSTWIEFSFAKPVDASGIQLVLDTGLHRQLTMSLQDKQQQNQHWGVPQPETLRHARVEIDEGRGWREVATLQDNHRRVVRLPFVAKGMTKLRLVDLASNGIDHVRIVEVGLME